MANNSSNENRNFNGVNWWQGIVILLLSVAIGYSLRPFIDSPMIIEGRIDSVFLPSEFIDSPSEFIFKSETFTDTLRDTLIFSSGKPFTGDTASFYLTPDSLVGVKGKVAYRGSNEGFHFYGLSYNFPKLQITKIDTLLTPVETDNPFSYWTLLGLLAGLIIGLIFGG